MSLRELGRLAELERIWRSLKRIAMVVTNSHGKSLCGVIEEFKYLQSIKLLFMELKQFM
jgi:hypothetical protein